VTLDFDPGPLAEFLRGRFGMPGAALAVERIGGGQSCPTYLLDLGGQRMVLRKQPAGPILRGAHAIDREFRVQSALVGSGVPVPRPILYHADPALIGTPFYLMARVEGRVFHDSALPGLAPAERRAGYLAMADTLAALHAVRPEAVGLEDFGRPGGYFARQVGVWSRQLAEAADPPGELVRLGAWLAANLPEDDGLVAIAHGDFRLGNLMFDARMEVAAVLDWELATIGHPLADLAFAAMFWEIAPEEYGGIRGLDLGGLGIPSRAEFVARYRARLPGVPAPGAFHVAFALFRFGVIFVGIAGRARAGTAADPAAARLAPLAGRFAAQAWRVLGGG
jgi:aminoglycoside phosphotransferase (APT) family kinase protein